MHFFLELRGGRQVQEQISRGERRNAHWWISEEVGEVEWFGGRLERQRRLQSDEMIDMAAELQKAQGQPVEFGVDEEEVVDAAGAGAGSVDRETVLGAELFGLGDGKEAIDSLLNHRLLRAAVG